MKREFVQLGWLLMFPIQIMNRNNLSVIFALLSLVLFCGGCAPQGASSVSKGLNSSEGFQTAEPNNSVMNGAQSPVKARPVFGPNQIELPAASLTAVKPQPNQALRVIYGAETTTKAPVIISWGKDGRVMANWPETPGNHHLLLTAASSSNVSAFSSAGAFIAGIESDGIFVRSINGGVSPIKLSRLTTRVTALEFSPDGDSLLIGGVDGMVYLWNFRDEMMQTQSTRPEWYLHRYPGLGASVSALKFHPNGRLFFASDLRGAVSAWEKYQIDGPEGYPKNITGRRFLTAQTPRSVVRRGDGRGVDRIALDSSAQFFALGIENGAIEIWKLRGLEKQGVVQAHDGQIISLEFDPTAQNIGELVSVGKDGWIRSWELVAKAKNISDEKKSIKKQQGDNTVSYKMIPTRVKEISLSNVITASFVPGRGYFVGSKDGDISKVQILKTN